MSAQKQCGGCGKDIYPMDEQLNVDGRIFHKKCFKCHDCSRQLTVMDYKKSSDYLDESFLLCQKHYDERFFLVRSKLKGNWKRSQDGSLIEIKYGNPNIGKTLSKPSDEKYEVADKVFLVSKFVKDANQFQVQIESERDDPVLVDLDMLMSDNLKVADGSSLNRGRFKLNPNSTSDVVLLERVADAKGYQLNAVVKVDSVELEALENPDTHLEERHEVADKVVLVSRRNAATKQFMLFIENNRDEALTFHLDFTGSKNVKVIEEPLTSEMHAFLSAKAKTVSEPLVLCKDDEEKDHDFSVDLHVHPEKKLMIRRWVTMSVLFILEERIEISENVFLISKFTKPDEHNQQKFIFQIENNTTDEIAVDMNLEGSENVHAPTTPLVFTAESGAVSNDLTLQKLNHKDDHNLVLNFNVKHIGEGGVIKKVTSGSTKNSAASSPQKVSTRKAPVASGISDAASVFGKSSFIPNPMTKLGTAEDVSVRYFGSQRYTMVAKA